MNEKYLSIDLNDPRTAEIAEIMTNKTCKKILVLITEKEMSESDIAKALGTPLNTVGYNIKKLRGAGLIEPAKNLWSVKGKRIHFYKIANKKIVISPKSMIRGIIPAVLISGVLALGIKLSIESQTGAQLQKANNFATERAVASVSEAGGSAAAPAVSGALQIVSQISYSWMWFLLGALVALFIFLIWNWRKI